MAISVCLAANRKQKRQTSVCLLQTDVIIGSFFFLVSSIVIDDSCFGKRACLWCLLSLFPIGLHYIIHSKIQVVKNFAKICTQSTS